MEAPEPAANGAAAPPGVRREGADARSCRQQPRSDFNARQWPLGGTFRGQHSLLHLQPLSPHQQLVQFPHLRRGRPLPERGLRPRAHVDGVGGGGGSRIIRDELLGKSQLKWENRT